MPIKKMNLGKHENILSAQYGTGDIKMTQGKVVDSDEYLLMLYNQPAKPIGYETDEWKGISTDELPSPDMVLSFTKVESVTALIHSLIELQQSMFEKQTQNK